MTGDWRTLRDAERGRQADIERLALGQKCGATGCWAEPGEPCSKATGVHAERTRVDVLDHERARSIAVALEQENAELRRRMGMYEDWQRQDDGDVVGQEGLPLGDPWSESPIPDDWREEE